MVPPSVLIRSSTPFVTMVPDLSPSQVFADGMATFQRQVSFRVVDRSARHTEPIHGYGAMAWEDLIGLLARRAASAWRSRVERRKAGRGSCDLRR